MMNLSDAGAESSGGAATHAAPARSVRTGRLRVLDGLRLFAALSVLAFHFTARDSYAWGVSPWVKFPRLSHVTQYGELGVNLFFVISGFVILMTAWGRSVESFSISRVTRLFPAYWVCVAATAALLIFVVPDSGVNLWQAVANLTMMQDAIDIRHVDGVYWTLWVELRFYLLMGLLLAWGLTRARVISLIVFWPLVAALVHTTEQQLLSSLLIWNYAPYFCVGMALFLIYREGGSVFHWLLVVYNWAFIVGLTGRYHPGGPLNKTSYLPSLLVQVVLITICIGLVALCTTDAAQKIEWRWLTTAGALTYPLYLLHEHWGWYFISKLREFTPTYMTLALATAACLLLAWLVHVAVERPLAPAMKRWLQHGLAVVQTEVARGQSTSPAAKP